ncbi:hypothetical protein COCC4DRAFT_50463 [Bipolaris maydis ATCC 48331]|uniref:Uncharacterized protein n=5 Tax=Bipolaris TaxID=33194 RepID=M2U6A7_COCH5|nr:uncharacterized protein COCSADRAFT_39742 [Bipolaris sorokiniana ND90Pr]XP_007714623.1 uncharacterized protein COCCADRAFT_102192 [Bipolaris zeicola 26-R-13]XP_014078926.1 uncharacterized protein COCC4DRAFT_50463 [Bipolaris maydis ATCC 48331]XP_014555063.1 hypothetical protein COCVIDRAFT_27976 [Bipolaris victoriae FI3]EMD89266.1 hypothetical protein COCHEDRAFT_1196178 [Bipolaris maydis C5]KAH7552618.1 hypothetical protein BM1_08569 [Bipolaris maydis]EMD61034.1 hypothetical protein COCSADRAFT
MIAQSIRASRQALVRVARQQPAYVARRTFITPTAVRSADLVQDMYLRELKNYKVPQVKASDAEGQVKKFAIPKAPASPEETDIASELKAYETQTVEVEGASSEDGEVLPQEDWFEEEDESITTAGATH